MNIAKKNEPSSNLIFKDDFKQNLKTWFENKGIKNKLEMYLRSQMIIEFQRNCGNSINPVENASISPKIQAVKLLIADFLVQEDLLFSLSIFCSEVPSLYNLTHFCSYVSHLAQPQKDICLSDKQKKPKFNGTDICNILDALSLNLNKEEIRIICNRYETSEFSSLLVCLLCMLPLLLKKYRYMEKILNKIRKREKYLKKKAKSEKMKSKQMYSVLQDAHILVQKHKSEMNVIFQKEDEVQKNAAVVEEKLSQLLKKEVELMNWQKSLESKENSFERNYEDNIEEIENKLKLLKEQDCELQNKYKTLREEQLRVRIEKEYIEEQKKLMANSKSNENNKLEEYELKFRILQDEVKEILKQCVCALKKKAVVENQADTRNISYRFDVQNQSQQTESDTFVNIEEYVNIIEKENSLLKMNLNKQRYHINQLTGEIVFLKNQLDYLQKEIEIRNQLQQKEMINKVAHKLYFPSKYLYSEEKNRKRDLFLENTPLNRVHSKQQFCNDVNMLKFLDASSSDNSKKSNLTDEIVADAKNKLSELENESKTLNHNFRILQNVLSRNIALNDRVFGSSSISDSSPQEKKTQFTPRLSRSISDLNGLNVSPEVKQVLKSNLQKFKENNRRNKADRNVLVSDSEDDVYHINSENILKNAKENNAAATKVNTSFRKIFLKNKDTKSTDESKNEAQLYFVGDFDSRILSEENKNVIDTKDVNDTEAHKIVSMQKSIETIENIALINDQNLNSDAIISNVETNMMENNKDGSSDRKFDLLLNKCKQKIEDEENDINRKRFEFSKRNNNVSRELFPAHNNKSESKSEDISGASINTKSSSDFWK